MPPTSLANGYSKANFWNKPKEKTSSGAQGAPGEIKKGRPGVSRPYGLAGSARQTFLSKGWG